MWTYNLFEAMRRLGVKQAKQPDLIRDQVMQALVVGDVSHLTSPLIAPMAWVGGYTGGGVADYASFQVFSRGVGGCLVRQLHFSRAPAAPACMTIEAADPLSADALVQVCDPQEMGPTAIQSVAKIDDSSVSIAANDVPRTYQSQYSVISIVEGLFIPRGHVFTLQVASFSTRIDLSALVQDVVAESVGV